MTMGERQSVNSEEVGTEFLLGEESGVETGREAIPPGEYESVPPEEISGVHEIRRAPEAILRDKTEILNKGVESLIDLFKTESAKSEEETPIELVKRKEARTFEMVARQIEHHAAVMKESVVPAVSDRLKEVGRSMRQFVKGLTLLTAVAAGTVGVTTQSFEHGAEQNAAWAADRDDLVRSLEGFEEKLTDLEIATVSMEQGGPGETFFQIPGKKRLSASLVDAAKQYPEVVDGLKIASRTERRALHIGVVPVLDEAVFGPRTQASSSESPKTSVADARPVKGSHIAYKEEK